MFYNFGDLPLQHNLFLDYLYEFENVKSYYKKNFREQSSYSETFLALSKKDIELRAKVSEIIKKQYEGLIPSFQTQSNIESLKSNTTFAVVTGQQLGIFGGPLYTFYKIITAIKLCSSLSEKYEHYQFVPVFWLEGDDHDFDEVRALNLMNENNESVTFTYNDGLDAETNRGSVGNIKFLSEINNVIERINSILRDNEFKPAILEKIKSCYKEGTSFKDAFKELIFNLFDEYGLIILDPSDKSLKEILKPIFKNELTKFREHSNDIIKTSASLEDLYHAQVKVRPINLFFTDDDGGRYLLEPVENEFRLKGRRKRITGEYLFDMIDNQPERFSANVLLRPICQDYLLPTAIYVGGPSELSYFAQVIPLYEKFGVVQPIVYPRASVTIIEKNVQKITEKFNLDYIDFFGDVNKISGKIINNLSEFDLESEFDKSIDEITLTVDRLKEKLFSIDKTLIDVTDKAKERINQTIGSIKEKAVEAQKKKHEATVRQLNKASSIIFPNGNFQERELNFIYFAHKYGMDILKRLTNEIVINKFEHQIIEL